MSEEAGQDALSRPSDEYTANEACKGLLRTGNRLRVGSTETGESSVRNSFTVEKESESFSVQDGDLRPGTIDSSGPARRSTQGGRGSHRSHRSRGSANFLVSNSIFEPPMGAIGGPHSPLETPTRRRDDPRDNKGKLVAWSPENKHQKNLYNFSLGTGESPLAASIAINATGGTENKSLAAANALKNPATHAFIEQDADAAAPKNLDVESAQIVNLALNLNESRRNVARRNTSTPLMPTLTGFGDGFSGGSLRQHLQMQRRSSRNASPKPERGVMTSPRIPSAQRMESSIQATVGTNRGADYQYQFSASTIARADKAKEAIELMAQYRQLLQYVPPLKPQSLTRISTRSPPSSAIGSPTKFAAPLYANGLVINDCNQLGRPYNPLQYIRNRKVRARERKTIDGESQGFGDVERVASWIDQVSKNSAQDDYQTYDCVQLPDISNGHDILAPSSSPLSTLGRNQATVSKHKRPRVDWITNPADMLADIYWLEQDDHKRLIEDNRERKIFPQYEFSRSPGQKDEGPPVGQDLETEDLDKKLRIDTELPNATSKRTVTDRHLDGARGRGLRKYHTSQFSEDYHRTSHGHRVPKSSHRSSSESSESDSRRRRPKFRRNATAGSNDLGTDILEKQMLEILAKESNRHGWVARRIEEGKSVLQTFTSPSVGLHESVSQMEHEGSSNDKTAPTSASKDGHHERKNSEGSVALANRRSLEVPDPAGRYSLDDLDSSAPNSPVARASNDLGFVPSIAADLSPPPSRKSSPTRHPTLAKVRSKINSLQDRSRNHSRSNSVRSASRNLEEDKERNKNTLEVPSTADDSRRPGSPTNKVLHRKAEENVQSSLKSGSLRRKAEELPAGIRGLFKTGRNPVQRLGGFIYRKETQASSMASSNTSSDDSDLEDCKSPAVSRTTTFDKGSKRLSRDVSIELSPLIERKSYELPTFSSPFDRRRKSAALNEDTESLESDYISHRQRVRERRLSRFQMLQPPRIDVQSASPHSSPDIAPDRTGRDSDVSDLENRRGSSLSVKTADARLNAILGMPGHSRAISGRDGFPVTGLTHLQDNPRESLASKRQWSISDCGVSPSRGPITKRDVARVRALLLSSGIKAKEITRRAAEIQDLRDFNKRGNTYAEIVALNREPQLLKPVPRSQAHILAARILSHDIQLSSQIWQESASNFSSQTVGGILDRVEELQDRILGRNGLSEMTRQAEREADEVSRDLIEDKTLAVKELFERMDKMIRRRRRRFRWVRRAGWVAVEWVLVGVMWWVWLVVVLVRFVTGTVGAVTRAVRWLLWL